MSIKKILILSILGFVDVLGAAKTGFAFSISTKGINTLNTIISPYIFSRLVNIAVPDQIITGGSLNNISISID